MRLLVCFCIVVLLAFCVQSVAAEDPYQFVAKWGSNGSDAGQFNEPRGIAVDTEGTVYVADTMNNRTQTFTPTGDFLMEKGTFGAGDGQFRQPRGIAVDTIGNVYVVDTANSRIQKFNSVGQFPHCMGYQRQRNRRVRLSL